MAGSIKDFSYTTGEGDTFYIRMDESNGELVGNVDLAADPAAGAYALPKNIKPRAARYRSLDGLYTRRIVCSTEVVLTNAPATIDIADGNGGTVQLLLAGRDGEKSKWIPRAADTGITDGDAT